MTDHHRIFLLFNAPRPSKRRERNNYRVAKSGTRGDVDAGRVRDGLAFGSLCEPRGGDSERYLNRRVKPASRVRDAIWRPPPQQDTPERAGLAPGSSFFGRSSVLTRGRHWHKSPPKWNFQGVLAPPSGCLCPVCGTVGRYRSLCWWVTGLQGLLQQAVGSLRCNDVRRGKLQDLLYILQNEYLLNVCKLLGSIYLEVVPSPLC